MTESSMLPAEEALAVPDRVEIQAEWTVFARNERVNRDWSKLIKRAPGAASRCYIYLCTTPTERYPGRVFPLRGQVYQGVWEYEVTSGDRVFYIPDEEDRKVMVFYAGPHVSPAPRPPR